MALKDMFKKKYNANVWCNNCNTHSEVSVPKGVTLNQFVESGACPNCGCATLVADYRQIDEYKSQPKPQVKLLRVGPQKQRRPQEVIDYPRSRPIEPPKRAPLPQQRPSTRPANMPSPPKPRPAEPDFTPRGIFRNDVDFWTGKPQRRDEEYENY
jgi:hypothetical protein